MSVPKFCKNLKFRLLLNKHGFYIIFEFEKVVLSKLGMFISKDMYPKIDFLS